MISADTGFWIALLSKNDHWHARAQSVFDGLDEGLVTTWPVLTETCHFLSRRIGEHAKQALLDALGEGAFELFPLTAGHASRMSELMRRYAGLPMDLADASLVLLAEHLGHGRILTTDRRDFAAYRWNDRDPFSNLLD